MCPAPASKPKIKKIQELITSAYVSLLTDVKTCSDIDPVSWKLKPDEIDNLLTALDEKMPPDFLKNKKSFASSCKPEETKVLKDTCDKFYVKSTKKGDKDTIGYGFCCETLKVCPPSDNSGSSPFYSQTWFFAVCGGVGLLLIGVIAAVVYFFCIRKKKGGGKSGGGMKSSKKGKTSKTSKSKSEALF